jgi:hypothetical protein
VNNGFEWIWKEAFLEQFGIYIYIDICLKGLGKTTQILSQDMWSPVRDWNSASPEYEAGLPTTQLQDLVI